MSDKRFTADELREMATVVFDGSDFQDDGCTVVYRNIYCGKYRFCPSKVAHMLRQAADAEEERVNRNNAYLAILKEDSAIHNENAQLKARLEAVVNMLANVNHECRYSNSVSMLKDEYDAILSVARGEGGAE